MSRPKISIIKICASAVAVGIFSVLMFACGGDSNPVNSNSGRNGGSSGREGIFTDSRDGKTYRYVTIGSQTWMADNLNFATSYGSWCYGNIPDNCHMIGRLYDWVTAMALPSSCYATSCANLVQSKHRGICPSGYHVPSNAEWHTLIRTVGGMETAGTQLKSLTMWNIGEGSVPGTDRFGFSALPGGFMGLDGNFLHLGDGGFWLSATEYDAARAMSWVTGRGNNDMVNSWSSKGIGISLRCVRD